MLPIRTFLAPLFVAGIFLCGSAQAQTVNRANWKLANRYTPEFLRQYVYSLSLTPGFINKSDNFWYSWRDSDGIKFWRVDPRAKKKAPLFDSAKMAAFLSDAVKKPYDTTNLPITAITFDTNNANLIRFTVENIRFEYDLKSEVLKNLGRATQGQDGQQGVGRGRGGGGGGFQGGFGQGNRDFRNYSPDRKTFVYAMDHNLYLVEVKDGKEQDPIQLTKDGEKDYSFGSRQEQEEIRQQFQQQDDEGEQTQNSATQNADKRVRANVTWSKDSKRFFVMRNDSRKVKDLYLVNSLSEPRPTLLTYKYAMPGEVDVPQVEIFAYDPEKKALIKLPVDRYRDQRLMNVHWQDTTSDSLRLVRRDRLQRNLELCEVDLKSNAVKVLLTEKVENAFLETQNVRYVKPGGDFIWFSERTGWGHFYLYSNDGKLKNALTSGAFRANDIVDVDEALGRFWFRGEGREPGENPYYRHLYSVKLDGSDLRLLDPGNADHNSVLSSSKDYAVDVYSRTDLAPVAVVLDDHGRTLLKLEEADLSRLEEMGWKLPETFKVKAADGVTDIYGNLWKPADFDPKKKYPIIANVYPGPQTESVSSTFSATATNQRLAQLGFIVIQIGNRGGNPARSNAYHSYGYYNLRDYGLADKKAGIEQLAARYPWIDIDKVGIYGHSGGGFMTAAALMLPPYNDFFKVGVSSSGNHDNNVYNQNWSEQHHGLRETSGNVGVRAGSGRPEEELGDMYDDGFNFDPFLELQRQGGQRGGQVQGQGQGQGQGQRQVVPPGFEIKVPTNHELAANLKGNLLLVHGDMDNNVHPAGTIRLVNALIRANKRFDLMIMPGKAHGYGDMQPYFNNLMMEYFSEHLLGDYYHSSADMRGN
ncbi:MAG TPA: DPP IV N-terminal domain-containing protein [Fimbriimonadaceae bacterium]|nr:DPP IV N-terminal domain-containing protein [Fimbriimonadaceae bacterium]